MTSSAGRSARTLENLAGADALRRAQQRPPPAGLLPYEEHLDGSAARPPQLEPGRNHLRLVEHEHVAATKKPGKVVEATMDRIALAGQVQEPGSGPFRRWRLGDPILGQLEVEVRGAHFFAKSRRTIVRTTETRIELVIGR
jgi:hypothetical protein